MQEKKTIRVLLFADDTEKRVSDEKKFNMAMRLCVSENAWEQVNEVLTMMKSTSTPEFCVEGVLGRHSVRRITELLEHGDVTWMLQKNLVDDATEKTRACGSAKHKLSIVAV